MDVQLFKRLENKRKIITTMLLLATVLIMIWVDKVLEGYLYSNIEMSKNTPYAILFSLGLSIVFEVFLFIIVVVMNALTLYALNFASTLMYIAKTIGNKNPMEDDKEIKLFHKIILIIGLVLFAIYMLIFLKLYIGNNFTINELESLCLISMVAPMVSIIINEIQYRIFKLSRKKSENNYQRANMDGYFENINNGK